MAIAVTCRAQDPPHRNYTVADGLPSNTVYWCMQDSDGYIWFGTDAGASRFDGLHFTNYTTSDGLADNEVLSIHQDSKGRIWFCTLNGKSSYFFQGRIRNVRTDTVLVHLTGQGGIRSFAEGGDHTIWFGDFNGRVRYLAVNGTVGVIELAERTTGKPGANTALVVDDELGLLGTAGTSVYRFQGRKAEYLFDLGIDAGPLAVRSNRGRAIMLGRMGLIQVGNDHPAVLVPSSDLVAPTVCSYMTATRSGEIWMNVPSGGTQCITERDGKWIAGGARFQQHLVASVFEDMEGNRWFCTLDAGVLVATSAQMEMRSYPASAGLSSASITCLHRDAGGAIWAGNSLGEVFRSDNLGWERIVECNGRLLAKDVVRAIDHDAEGGLWATSDTRTLYLTHPFGPSSTRQVPKVDERDSLSCTYTSGLKSLAVDRSSGRVMGSAFGLAEVIDTLGGPTFVFRQTLWRGTTRIYAPHFDPTGTFWFETNDLLWRIKEGVRDSFPQLAPAFQVRIQDIASLDDRTLVVATAGSGVKLVRHGEVLSAFTIVEGMPSDQARALAVVDGKILVATDRGVALIADPLGKGSIAVWDLEAGLPSENVLDVACDGRLMYVGSAAGLCVLPIDAGQREPFTPSVRFMAISADGSPDIDLTGPVTIAPGTRKISITAQALAFSDANGPDYQYKLDDAAGWSASATGVITLEEPDAGYRVLRVRARALSGAWSLPAELRFHVREAWIRTVWARIGFMAFITGLGVVIVYYLTRRKLKEKLIALEQERALQEERGRIARDVHDDLGADLSQLLMLTRHSMGSSTLEEIDRRNLREIELHSGTMVRKIDEIIWNLDPADDTLNATLTFIQRQAEDFAAQHGMEFRTRPIGDMPEQVFPARDRRELHLLVKEVLTNIAKHTDTSFLRMEAEVRAGQVFIVIEDNGIAKRSTTARNGHGLESMRARIDQLGGTIEREAIRPAGTRVRISFALPHSHPY